MSNQVKCEYCGQLIDASAEVCPYCGAPNEHMARGGTGIPQTIEELKAFAAAHNLPLQKMRFFIGEDYKGAKAFGIYKDEDGRFVVYKNKADGTRAVRYRGGDEAYAVNEIYQKLRSEVNVRAHRSGSKKSAQASQEWRRRRRINTIKQIVIPLVLCFILVCITVALQGPSDGYYDYGDDLYYNQGSSWYLYDNDDWVYTDDVPSALTDDPDSYYDGYSYDSGYGDSYGASDFSDTDYYDSYESDSSSSSWDSDDWDDDDWDYDYGSWDSGGTDWDSDW